MAAKMAAMNTKINKCAISSLLTYLETYFLDLVIYFGTQGLCITLVAYNVCKSKMAAKMPAVNVKNVCSYKFCLCMSSVYAESST